MYPVFSQLTITVPAGLIVFPAGIFICRRYAQRRRLTDRRTHSALSLCGWHTVTGTQTAPRRPIYPYRGAVYPGAPYRRRWAAAVPLHLFPCPLYGLPLFTTQAQHSRAQAARYSLLLLPPAGCSCPIRRRTASSI